MISNQLTLGSVALAAILAWITPAYGEATTTPGRDCEIWNTHFDHEIELARQKSVALRDNEGFSTFHGHKAPSRDGVRIDWILAHNPVAVSEAAIVVHASPDLAPSDHFPVTATVRF